MHQLLDLAVALAQQHDNASHLQPGGGGARAAADDGKAYQQQRGHARPVLEAERAETGGGEVGSHLERGVAKRVVEVVVVAAEEDRQSDDD